MRKTLARTGFPCAVVAALMTLFVGCPSTSSSDDSGGAPAAPSGLAGTNVSTDQVSLGWVDNSDDEDGFVVERAFSADGVYAEVETVEAGTTAYTNTGLSPLTSYWFRVRAYNGNGGSYSNVEEITTDAAPAPDYVITYKVSGTSAAAGTSIQYGDAGGSLVTVTPSALPWEQSVTSNTLQFGYAVQATSTETSVAVTLTAELWKDGVLMKSQTASSTDVGGGVYWPPSVSASYFVE